MFGAVSLLGGHRGELLGGDGCPLRRGGGPFGGGGGLLGILQSGLFHLGCQLGPVGLRVAESQCLLLLAAGAQFGREFLVAHRKVDHFCALLLVGVGDLVKLLLQFGASTAGERAPHLGQVLLNFHYLRRQGGGLGFGLVGGVGNLQRVRHSGEPLMIGDVLCPQSRRFRTAVLRYLRLDLLQILLGIGGDPGSCGMFSGQLPGVFVQYLIG